tara:strand:- start:2649 stop:4061 length:1413 start_codon:yes stop_codon:yes gene_type:complete
MSDSYKLNHWNQYRPGTSRVYSYFESRPGAEFDFTCFYGLQLLLKEHFIGKVVTREDIEWGAQLARHHFGTDRLFNREGWEYILGEHGGRLPLRIRAVPEGTCVPTNHVLMTVENTDDKCFWLTNYVESLLTHVWYPATVATLSRQVKIDLWADLIKSCDNPEAVIPFMLHDFGYRGVTGDQAARRGGSGHIVNFLGTDTVPGMEEAFDFYSASLDGLAYSVPATEHSVMTAGGPDGEPEIVGRLLEEYPSGILSLVGDSFDIYNFVDNIIGKQFKEQVRARKANAFGVRKTVTRPDSSTDRHPEPEDQMLWIAETHWRNFDRGTTNNKGYRVFEDCIGALWGDGIDRGGINRISKAAIAGGFSAENFVYGMGGGLLQKINRDTQRFAFKCSAQNQSGEWVDIYKDPLDKTKASKRGRMKLVRDDDGGFHTLTGQDAIDDNRDDVLTDVFLNGELKVDHTFSEIRERAAV